jgi:hypothetical protein
MDAIRHSKHLPDLMKSFQNLSAGLNWAHQHLSTSTGSSEFVFEPLHPAYSHLESSNELLANLTYGSSNGNGSGGNSSLDPDLEPYIPYHQRPETYIVPVLFAIIFIIGVLGNGTLILIFLKHRTMRNVPNM